MYKSCQSDAPTLTELGVLGTLMGVCGTETFMRFSLLVLILVLPLTACVEQGLSPRSPTPGMPSLKVMTFNVHLKAFDDQATVNAIGADDADIIALQEVSGPWEDVLIERYSESYPYQLYFTDGMSSKGLAFLSRYPLQDQGFHAGIDGGHPAWHVLAETPIGPVELLNVHLRAPFTLGIGGAFEVDDVHTTEIDLFSQACSPEVTTIVLGDFNESVDGIAVQALEARGFTNLLPIFHPGQETWSYQKSLGGQARDTLDHILVDDAFRPLNAYVLRQGNSDHLPVVAIIEPTPIFLVANTSP